MFGSLAFLLVLLATAYVWHAALQAREQARAHCYALCSRAGVQLLDQTVALRRLRLQRVPGRGIGLRRCYGFELSTNGIDRHGGSLDLVDGELVAYFLPVTDPAAASDPARGGNVIELHPPRTLH